MLERRVRFIETHWTIFRVNIPFPGSNKDCRTDINERLSLLLRAQSWSRHNPPGWELSKLICLETITICPPPVTTDSNPLIISIDKTNSFLEILSKIFLHLPTILTIDHIQYYQPELLKNKCCYLINYMDQEVLKCFTMAIVVII